MAAARGVVDALLLLTLRRCRGTYGGWDGAFRGGDPFLAEELGGDIVTPTRKAMIRPVGVMSTREKKGAPRNSAGLMGGTRLELVTSTMSTWRSNQLS